MFYLGIDLAKDTFAACLLDHEKSIKSKKSFRRTLEGLQALVDWVRPMVDGDDVWLVMEATGDLWCVPALILEQQANFQISVVNPKKVHNFAKTLLRRHKTDELDAHLLALFARQMEPALWVAIDPIRLKLRSMTRRIQQLVKTTSKEKTRLKHEALSEQVQDSLKRSIDFHQGEQKRLWDEIESLVASNENLKEDVVLVASIDSIGRKSALKIVGEMLSVSRFKNAKAVASWAGLIPSHFESGTSVKKADKLTQEGSRPIRGILYMPAMAGIRHNVAIRALSERLKKSGKSGKTRVVAGMHKLLRQVYGVLKHRQLFDPQKALSGCTA